jgi:ADP-ribosyl-[dinitrogen reductase] hydrolase
MPADLLDRYQGCLLGLACGDAVGTTVEFSARESFKPVTDMLGGGPFDLQPGQWTDDTSMALCLAASLVHCLGFEPVDQMNRYVNWWQWGYYSSTGDCFDIGATTAKALQRYLVTRDPVAGSKDPNEAGNGSLMRLAPIALFFHPDSAAVRYYARRSSELTHAAPEAVECCELFAAMLNDALQGKDKAEILQRRPVLASMPKVRAIEGATYLGKERAQIRGTGYCIESLEAALWCFARTSSFEEAILAAANLGDDADTTAAITGQLAGAYHGASSIPGHWLERLHMQSEIARLACALMAGSR